MDLVRVLEKEMLAKMVFLAATIIRNQTTLPVPTFGTRGGERMSDLKDPKDLKDLKENRSLFFRSPLILFLFSRGLLLVLGGGKMNRHWR